MEPSIPRQTVFSSAAVGNSVAECVNRPSAPAPPQRVESSGKPPETRDSQPRPWRLRLLRRVMRRLMKSVGDPPIAVVLADGRPLYEPQHSPVARVRIRDGRTLLALALDPHYRFGEAYAGGSLEVEGDLVRLLVALEHAASGLPDRWFSSSRLSSFWHRPRRTSLRAARDNIHHHYDLGNDFYRLWLDEQLVYTCAYFTDPANSLEQAQIDKMDHVCRKLQLRPGQEVVEAGCGWGALALHMARHYGVKVTAYNISHEQIVYARQRAEREGLADRVTFVEDDWRAIRGRFDVFVSVGMLEHVGPRNYAHLGALIDSVLRPGGRGLIHTIGRNRPRPVNPWIERRIFPGGYPPSLKQMMRIFEPRAFSVLDVENLRLHYAETLRHWLMRFEQSVDTVRSMFDERFVRAWRLYLSGSIAAFEAGNLQLFQVVFARHDDNAIPWTRRHLYCDTEQSSEAPASFSGTATPTAEA